MAISDEERQRLAAVLAGAATRIKRAWIKYLERVQSKAVLDELIGALESYDATKAISIIQSYADTLSASIAETFASVATDSVDEFSAEFMAALEGDAAGGGAGGAGAAAAASPEFGASVGIGFDPTNPRAAEIMRTEARNFIAEITQTQAETVRAAIADAFEQGLGPKGAAMRIRETVGLTKLQNDAVENYRRLLQAGSREATTRALRDRRSDTRIDRIASGKGKPLSDQEVERMVAGYRRRFVAMRAETIARTEGTRVTALARDESFRQIAQKLGIGHNRIIRIWNWTDDDRTREWHSHMQDAEAPLGGYFIDGLGNKLARPGDPDAPAETIINCRCTLTFRIAPA